MESTIRKQGESSIVTLPGNIELLFSYAMLVGIWTPGAPCFFTRQDKAGSKTTACHINTWKGYRQGQEVSPALLNDTLASWMR